MMAGSCGGDRGDRRGAGGGGGGAAAARPGAARARAAGDGQGRGAGPRLARSRAGAGDPGDGAALAGAFARGRGRRPGRCAPSGPPAEGRRRLPGGAGAGGDDAAARAGAALRRLDLGPAERLPGRDRPECASPRAGCGCCCAGSASPAAGPSTRWRHLQDPAEVAACEERLAAAGEKGGRRAGALRAALSRTRPTWRPTRT